MNNNNKKSNFDLIMKYSAIILLVLGVIGSFVIAHSFGFTTQMEFSHITYEYETTSEMNELYFPILLTCLLSQFLFFMLLYGFGQLLSYQRNISEKLDQLTENPKTSINLNSSDQATATIDNDLPEL